MRACAPSVTLGTSQVDLNAARACSVASRPLRRRFWPRAAGKQEQAQARRSVSNHRSSRLRARIGPHVDRTAAMIIISRSRGSGRERCSHDPSAPRLFMPSRPVALWPVGPLGLLSPQPAPAEAPPRPCECASRRRNPPIISGRAARSRPRGGSRGLWTPAWAAPDFSRGHLGPGSIPDAGSPTSHVPDGR